MNPTVCTSGELYWPGNAVKTKVIREIVHGALKKPSVVIFDYGCGEAGHWRVVLDSFPNFYLIAYDLDPRARHVARKHLAGLKAEVLDDVEHIRFQADYIVSFSVLEHVYDRKQYLTVAKEALAPEGLFYLNYDDGHFRICLDMSDHLSWTANLRTWLHNILAPLLAKAGYKTKFQARVNKLELHRLLKLVGFEVQEEFYGNIACLKGLCKYIPQNKIEDFMNMWVCLEERLNEHFLEELGRYYAGDNVNLWRFMASRTLVLRHKEIL